MANKLTDEKRAEMFAAYCEKQNIQYVSRKLQVSRTTVARYCKKDDWDKRVAKIEKKTATRVDNSIVKMKARHAKYGQVLQQMFHKSFINADGSLDMVAVRRLGKKELIKALEAGIKIEREAVGEEANESINIEIKLPKGMSLGHRKEL